MRTACWDKKILDWRQNWRMLMVINFLFMWMLGIYLTVFMCIHILSLQTSSLLLQICVIQILLFPEVIRSWCLNICPTTRLDSFISLRHRFPPVKSQTNENPPKPQNVENMNADLRRNLRLPSNPTAPVSSGISGSLTKFCASNI